MITQKKLLPNLYMLYFVPPLCKEPGYFNALSLFDENIDTRDLEKIALSVLKDDQKGDLILGPVYDVFLAGKKPPISEL